MCWNTVLPAAKNNFLIVTFRFRVIQLTKLPRVFVERSEELQVSCDTLTTPGLAKVGLILEQKIQCVHCFARQKIMVCLRLKTVLICVQPAFFGR